MKRRVNGNVTVYMGMVTGIVMTLVFSLIEVAHWKALGQEQDVLSQVGAESVMADYCRPLWDDYGILAVDGGYGSATFSQAALENRALSYVEANSHNSLLSLQGTGVSVKDYALLSDYHGRAFLKEAAIAELYGIPEQLLSQQESYCNSVESDAASTGSVEDVLTNAQSSLDEAEELQNSASSEEGETTVEEPPSDPPENPILKVQEWKAQGVLAQVLPSDVTLSGGVISDDRPSMRTLQQGQQEALALSSRDRVLYGFYLQSHFQNYTHPMQHDGLAYEWEYVINGKSGDEENLKLTVEKLLAIREVQNFVAIHRISSCTATAEATATALVGFTGNPLIINGVKEGILAAWAYMESVLDVRALLSGKKVPFIKTADDWTSDLANLGACFDVSTQAKESKNGISYEAYLIALTYLESTDTVGDRCLDVVEAAVQQNEGYGQCRIDNFVVQGTFLFSYEGRPTFASMVPQLRGRMGRYTFSREWEMSYIT